MYRRQRLVFLERRPVRGNAFPNLHIAGVHVADLVIFEIVSIAQHPDGRSLLRRWSRSRGGSWGRRSRGWRWRARACIRAEHLLIQHLLDMQKILRREHAAAVVLIDERERFPG